MDVFQSDDALLPLEDIRAALCDLGRVFVESGKACVG